MRAFQPRPTRPLATAGPSHGHTGFRVVLPVSIAGPAGFAAGAVSVLQTSVGRLLSAVCRLPKPSLAHDRGRLSAEVGSVSLSSASAAEGWWGGSHPLKGAVAGDVLLRSSPYALGLSSLPAATIR